MRKIRYPRGEGRNATFLYWDFAVRMYLRDYQTTMRDVSRELGFPYYAVREVLWEHREADLYHELCERLAEEAEAEAKSRKCGAMTRTGKPCKAPGKWRGGKCRVHGGLSSGAKTQAGKERARQAVIRRWARVKAEQAVRPSG